MKFIRELRLIPVVLFATVCLLALKVLGFIVDDNLPGDIDAAIASRAPLAVERSLDPTSRQAAGGAAASGSWAKDMFNFPSAGGSSGASPGSPPSPPRLSPPVSRQTAADLASDITGSSHGSSEPPKPAKPKPADPPPTPDGTLVPLQPAPIPPGERALLERLQERRQELEARGRELEIRENLLREAEKQLELKMNEVKDMEERINAAAQQKDDTAAQKFKTLVTMYENMRAKDAARIFDRLDMKVLLDVASQMNPRRMSDIMAQMQPEAAEKLTVELANRAGSNGRPTQALSDLPKIEGRPKTQ